MITASLVRAEVVTYAPPLDQFENPCGEGRQQIVFRHMPILQYTACGAWIDMWGVRKFVNLRATKQYASANEAEALNALRHRKQRQVAILSAQLRTAQRALRLIEISC